jgi:hypothetical protein
MVKIVVAIVLESVDDDMSESDPARRYVGIITYLYLGGNSDERR